MLQVVEYEGEDEGRSLRFKNGKRYLPFAYRFFRGEGYPDSVVNEGLRAVFRTDFRVWLEYDQALRSEFLADQERAGLVMSRCYEAIPEGFPPGRLIEGAVWFYGADHISREPLLEAPEYAAFKSVLEDRLEKDAKTAEQWGQEFSLFWDAQTIRSSFLAHHKIDLFKAALHWWDFLGLLAELPEGCRLNRVRHLRAMKVDDAPKEARTDLRIDKMLLRVPDQGIV